LTKHEENKDKRVIAARFFDEVLVPLAASLRAGGKLFFSLRADPQSETYFVEPARRVMTPDAFELRAAESRSDFISELIALWINEGNEELAAMGRQLLELAAELAVTENHEVEDVSAFMYVMF
jgi:hypothetical protein